MEEIKIGEYVRTKNGKIIKCTGFGTFRKDGQSNRVKTIISGHCHYIYDYIVKHSLSIIDLIGPGDYLDGVRVDIVDKDQDDHVIYAQNYDLPAFDLKNIKSIVTKEQFESVEYKLDN